MGTSANASGYGISLLNVLMGQWPATGLLFSELLSRRPEAQVPPGLRQPASTRFGLGLEPQTTWAILDRLSSVALVEDLRRS